MTSIHRRPTRRSVRPRRGLALAIGLALAASLGTGCATQVPVEEFQRFDESILGLRQIANQADAELEALAFDALVAKSRRKTRLRRENLDPNLQFEKLWMLVDARHSSLTFLSDYLGLLVDWSGLATENYFQSFGRVVFTGRSEEATVQGAVRSLRSSGEDFEKDIEEIGGEDFVGVSQAAVKLVDRCENSSDDLGKKPFLAADDEKLAHLIGKTNGEMVTVMEATGRIEAMIRSRIEGMASTILENYNAARPPAYRSDRLSFDAEAIQRIARAKRLERTSDLLSQANARVAGALRELEEGTRKGLSTEALENLEALFKLVERGPERVRGEPGYIEQRSLEEPMIQQQMEMLEMKKGTKKY